MDTAQRYFLNPEAVSKHLYCSICQDVFNNPQRAPCGHSFCKDCIFTWLQRSKTCPEDRKPVTWKQLHYDFILANIIGDQQVACPYRSKGCDNIGKLENLTSHRNVCTFNPSNLPAFMKEENTEKSFTDNTGHDENKLPTPAKPSLKMRLFQDASKRSLLCSVFDNRDNIASGSSSNEHRVSTNNVWLGKGNPKKKKVILIDDSF